MERATACEHFPPFSLSLLIRKSLHAWQPLLEELVCRFPEHSAVARGYALVICPGFARLLIRTDSSMSVRMFHLAPYNTIASNARLIGDIESRSGQPTNAPEAEESVLGLEPTSLSHLVKALWAYQPLPPFSEAPAAACTHPCANQLTGQHMCGGLLSLAHAPAHLLGGGCAVWVPSLRAGGGED